MAVTLGAGDLAWIVPSILAIPGSMMAYDQIRDRRKRALMEHISRQVTPSNGVTVANMVEELRTELADLAAAERSTQEDLGVMRRTQVDMYGRLSDMEMSQADIATTLGRHLDEADKARRTLGLDPEP